MKTTIIIPAYNEEDEIPKLFESIKEQSYSDYEIIVADANSKDRTVEIARSYGAKVIPGGLPGPGRNAGARSATGSILVFFDADVVLPDKDFLKTCIEEFEARALGVATCHLDADSDKFHDRFLTSAYNLYVDAVKKFLPHAGGFCIFARRDVHEAIGGFDERVLLCEDMDYVQRAVKYAPFNFLKNRRMPMSVRRFDRDGRLATVIRYVLAEFHILFFGSIKTDIFKYRFGYKKPVNDHQAQNLQK